MGIKQSKNGNKNKNNLEIVDYNNLSYPKEFELIKISSYNVDIKNTVNSKKRILDFIKYFIGLYKNKEIDIMCIQGIHDYNSAYNLIKNIKIHARRNRISLYFAPDFDEIDVTDDATSDFISIKSVSNESIKHNKKNRIQNIIISKYPIVTTIYSELDINNTVDDILGTNTVIGANISIYGNIISLYNTALVKDIKSANILYNDVRESELTTLFSIIEENNKNLNTVIFNNYFKTNINLLVGSLNINEMYHGGLSSEYANLIKTWKCVDIYRVLNGEKQGFTNSSNERLSYIFMILTNDLYDKKSKFAKKFQKIRDSEELISLIFQRYTISFLDSCVRTDVNPTTGFTNYPVESVFMIYKNKH